MYKIYYNGEEIYTGDDLKKIKFKLLESSKKHSILVDYIIEKDDKQVFNCMVVDRLLIIFKDDEELLSWNDKNCFIFNLTNK